MRCSEIPKVECVRLGANLPYKCQHRDGNLLITKRLAVSEDGRVRIL
ncbi:hypothetical protein [Streptomyces qinglanensis]